MSDNDTFGWRDFETSIILNCIDKAEFDDLNDVTRDWVAMIIGAGEIDFRNGSPMWNLLHMFFPTGSNTWTALMDAATRSKPRGI